MIKGNVYVQVKLKQYLFILNKQNLSGYPALSALLNWNYIFLLTLYKSWLLLFLSSNQNCINTWSLIEIKTLYWLIFYLLNHYWLRFAKSSLTAKGSTKISFNQLSKQKNKPIYNYCWMIELGNTISKKRENIRVVFFIQILVSLVLYKTL